MTNGQKQFLENIQSMLEEKHQTKLSEDGLAFLMENVGIHSSSVKGELCFFTEDCGIEGVDSGILQILFTVSFEYRKDQTERLLARLDELNKRLMIGCFNLYEPLGHIIYRYGLPLPELDSPEASQLLFITLAKMSNAMELLLNYILMLAEDVDTITLDEYLEELDILRKALEEDPDFIKKYYAERNKE